MLKNGGSAALYRIKKIPLPPENSVLGSGRFQRQVFLSGLTNYNAGHLPRLIHCLSSALRRAMRFAPPRTEVSQQSEASALQ